MTFVLRPTFLRGLLLSWFAAGFLAALATAGEDGLGRAYPYGTHECKAGKACWPYDYSRSVVPQKAGYGFYPTMWRDWHENAYMIFSEPEHTHVDAPRPKRSRRGKPSETLPNPQSSPDTEPAPDNEFAPPPPEEMPFSEMPDVTNEPSSAPAEQTPPAQEQPAEPMPAEPMPTEPMPTQPGVPEDAGPTTPTEPLEEGTPPADAPPAEAPQLPNFDEPLPGSPQEATPLPGGTPAQPMSGRKPVWRPAGEATEGPSLERAYPNDAAVRRPVPQVARRAEHSEADTLRALSQGFESDSRVQPASAELPIEERGWSRPSDHSVPRLKIDHQVAPAAANLPATRVSVRGQSAPRRDVSQASYESVGSASVGRAVATEPVSAKPDTSALLPEHAPVRALPPAGNPLRGSVDTGRATRPGNPLRR